MILRASRVLVLACLISVIACLAAIIYTLLRRLASLTVGDGPLFTIALVVSALVVSCLIVALLLLLITPFVAAVSSAMRAHTVEDRLKERILHHIEAGDLDAAVSEFRFMTMYAPATAIHCMAYLIAMPSHVTDRIVRSSLRDNSRLLALGLRRHWSLCLHTLFAELSTGDDAEEERYLTRLERLFSECSMTVMLEDCDLVIRDRDHQVYVRVQIETPPTSSQELAAIANRALAGELVLAPS